MQVISDSAQAEVAGKLGQDLALKLNVTELETAPDVSQEKAEVNENDDAEEENEDDDEEEEEEFTFLCTNPDGSPISADDIFCNGQIRPMFPFFNRNLLFDDGDVKSESSDSLRPPLKKLFVEEQASGSSSEADEPEGPFCAWTGKAIEASPEACKKSNSTGFSKLWRFRELVLRSNSDGKDAFVFLNNPNNSTAKSMKTTAKSTKTTPSVTTANETATKRRGKSKETVSSVHERHYGKNRASKEGEKRKSYLPYRQDIFGFFTNVNGLSRNVHPF